VHGGGDHGGVAGDDLLVPELEEGAHVLRDVVGLREDVLVVGEAEEAVVVVDAGGLVVGAHLLRVPEAAVDAGAAPREVGGDVTAAERQPVHRVGAGAGGGGGEEQRQGGGVSL